MTNKTKATKLVKEVFEVLQNGNNTWGANKLKEALEILKRD